MKHNEKSSNIKFGLLSIIVLVSGCAVNPNPNPYVFDDPLTVDPPRGPIMTLNDLNDYQLNCNKDQVEFLQGMRRTDVERQKSTFGSLFKEHSASKPSKRSNWIVNQHLMQCRGYDARTWGYEYYNNIEKENKENGKRIRKERMDTFSQRGWK
jgi:hypothetical protein